jgi:hypothetical protein
VGLGELCKAVEMTRAVQEYDKARINQFQDYYTEKLRIYGFKAFGINRTESIRQRECEQEAMAERQKGMAKHVLAHWVEVGNYWINKSYHPPKPISKLVSVPKSPIISPNRSPNRSRNRSPIIDDKYSYTLSKPVNSDAKINPKRLNFESEKKPILISEKERKLRQWLDSMANNKNKKGDDIETSANQEENAYVAHGDHAKLFSFDRSPDKQMYNTLERDIHPYEHCNDSVLTEEVRLDSDKFGDIQQQKELEEQKIKEQQEILVKQAEKVKQQELVNRSEFLKSQVNLFEHKSYELQNLEIQYTMNGDDYLLSKAKEI